MKNTIILFSSEYGHTKEYAEYIGKRLDIKTLNVENIKEESLKDINRIVYGSSLYAGKLKNSNLIKNYLEKEIIIFTVGLADPTESEYKETLDQNFTKEEQEKIKFIHLRGGINYEKMSIKHKMMMYVMTKFLIKKELKENPTPELIVLNKSYGKTEKIFDEEGLNSIITYLK